MANLLKAKSKTSDPTKNVLYKGRKSYNPYELALATGYVRQKRMGLSEASRHYGIPYSTLKDHVDGRIKGNGKRGPDPTFNDEEEAAIVAYLQKMSNWGFSHSRDDLQDLLKEFCDLKVLNFLTIISTYHYHNDVYDESIFLLVQKMPDLLYTLASKRRHCPFPRRRAQH